MPLFKWLIARGGKSCEILRDVVFSMTLHQDITDYRGVGLTQNNWDVAGTSR